MQVLHGVRPSQPPRPRVMQGLAARLNLKRSQGRPWAGYRAAKRVEFRGADPVRRREGNILALEWLGDEEPRAVGCYSACNFGSDSNLMQSLNSCGASFGGISAMQQALRHSSLVPSGFVVESAFYEADRAVFTVRASSGFGLCPSCGTVSRRVHSRYRRRVTAHQARSPPGAPGGCA